MRVKFDGGGRTDHATPRSQPPSPSSTHGSIAKPRGVILESWKWIITQLGLIYLNALEALRDPSFLRHLLGFCLILFFSITAFGTNSQGTGSTSNMTLSVGCHLFGVKHYLAHTPYCDPSISDGGPGSRGLCRYLPTGLPMICSLDNEYPAVGNAHLSALLVRVQTSNLEDKTKILNTLQAVVTQVHILKKLSDRFVDKLRIEAYLVLEGVSFYGSSVQRTSLFPWRQSEKHIVRDFFRTFILSRKDKFQDLESQAHEFQTGMDHLVNAYMQVLDAVLCSNATIQAAQDAHKTCAGLDYQVEDLAVLNDVSEWVNKSLDVLSHSQVFLAETKYVIADFLNRSSSGDFIDDIQRLQNLWGYT